MRPPPNQRRLYTKRVPPPRRGNRLSSLSSGRLGPPTPARAPPRAALDRGSRLAHGMSANSGWSKGSHAGAVVAFPEAITGQAQSFASVSSSSWQPSVRAPSLQYPRPPSTSLGSLGLICATRLPHAPPLLAAIMVKLAKVRGFALAATNIEACCPRSARARGAARRRASAPSRARSRAPCCGKSRVISGEVSRLLATWWRGEELRQVLRVLDEAGKDLRIERGEGALGVSMEG